MLKSSPILTKNGAHLVEKMTFEKNKDYRLSRFECFEHAKTFLICVKLWECNFAIDGKYSTKLWKYKLLCFPCDISNIQKCNFKDYPFIWVAPFTMILHVRKNWKNHVLFNFTQWPKPCNNKKSLTNNNHEM
jgi:hypothetical protein